MVAAQAHQKGSKKSATSPSSMKTIQNIFFCMGTIVVAWQRQHSKPLPQGVNERYRDVTTPTAHASPFWVDLLGESGMSRFPFCLASFLLIRREIRKAPKNILTQ